MVSLLMSVIIAGTLDTWWEWNSGLHGIRDTKVQGYLRLSNTLVPCMIFNHARHAVHTTKADAVLLKWNKICAPPCMQMMRSSMRAASGSQLKRLFRRCQAHSPCWSPMRSMHSSRKPKRALMSAACICMPPVTRFEATIHIPVPCLLINDAAATEGSYWHQSHVPKTWRQC